MKISIGNVNVELMYAMGVYEANCIQAIELNPFDKVICGLLARHGKKLSIKELGVLMGLNVVDDPTNWKYADEAECQILNNAIESLVSFQLVEKDTNGNVILTQDGERSIAEGRKYKRSTQTKTIYFDILSGKDNFAAAIGPKLSNSMSEVEPDDGAKLVDDMRVRKCFMSLFPELSDKGKGNSIGRIDTCSLKYYKAEITFEVIFDFSSSSYEIFPADDIRELEEMTADPEFCRSVLAKYFSGAKEAVVYKPQIQLDLEQDANDRSPYEGTIYGKKEFIAHLLNATYEDTLGICLYLDTLDTPIVNHAVAFVERNNNTLLCVEYSKGDERFNGCFYTNLGFARKEELSVSDVCVCSDDTYYKEELFVFPFEEKDYQVPVVVKHNEKRYRFPVLTRPFVNAMIDNLVNDFAAKAERTIDIIEINEIKMQRKPSKM